MTINNGKSTLGIHFFYVALILTLVIILLATAQWTELPHFTDYLSTAATITSLVLALLAIIYAFISNDSLSQATGVVTEAANEAQDATAKIAVLLSSVQSLTNGANDSNSRLADISQKFEAQMGVLTDTVSTLELQANAISDVLPEIPKGLNAIEKRFDEFAQSAKASGANEAPLPAQQMDEVAATAVKNASPAGLLLLHACYLSKQTQKSFDIKELFDAFPEYVRGYMLCLSSIDLISFDKEINKYPIVTVIDCSDQLNTARDEYLKRMENTDGTKPKGPVWKHMLDKVESHFSAEGQQGNA